MTVVTQAFFKALKTTKSFSGASCFLSRCLIYKVHAASRRSSLSPSDLIILPQVVSLVKNFFQVFQTFFDSGLFRSSHPVRFSSHRRALAYIIRTFSVCQHLFSTFFKFLKFFRFNALLKKTAVSISGYGSSL